MFFGIFPSSCILKTQRIQRCCLPLLTWGWKQIALPKRCILFSVLDDGFSSERQRSWMLHTIVRTLHNLYPQIRTAIFKKVKKIYNRYDRESIPGTNMNFCRHVKTDILTDGHGWSSLGVTLTTNFHLMPGVKSTRKFPSTSISTDYVLLEWCRT